MNWFDFTDHSAITRLYVSYTGGPPSPANCATMGANIAASAQTALAALVNNNVTLENVEVTDLTSSMAGQGVGGTPWAGTRGTAMLGPQVALLGNLTIGRRYRGGKPRNYWPFGVSADVSSAGQWTTTFITASNTALRAFFSALTTDGAGCTIVGLVNVSYFSGFTNVTNPITGRTHAVPKLRVGGPQQDLVTGVNANPSIGSQRRRARNQ
jgi:hypothetical protein